MKKLILSACALMVCLAAGAQNNNIVESISRITTTTVEVQAPRPPKSQWYFRGGLNIANFAGDDADEAKSKVLYNAGFGFQRFMGKLGAYWGMEFAAGSRGSSADFAGGDYTMTVHNFQYSPFTFGWKIAVIDKVKIDPHVGMYASYDYAGKDKITVGGEEFTDKMSDWEGWRKHDVGLNAGVGVWYDRWNLDLTFQRGFVEAYKETDMFTSNFMIRLGVAF